MRLSGLDLATDSWTLSIPLSIRLRLSQPHIPLSIGMLADSCSKGSPTVSTIVLRTMPWPWWLACTQYVIPHGNVVGCVANQGIEQNARR